MVDTKIQVSVIIPIFNGAKWLDQCFNSILNQTAIDKLSIEVCGCNDASTDETVSLLNNWSNVLQKRNINLNIFNSPFSHPKGVGYGKNKSIEISQGEYLCFQDIDDIMLPNRILAQYKAAKSLPNNTIVGSKFVRKPEGSTARYTKWANSLTPEQLNYQIYTSNGPTVIMPTWFCHRSVFQAVGKFSEEGKGTPEDLIFFYRHLDLKGRIFRVDECLLEYNFHPEATTFSITEEIIWKKRIDHLESNVLCRDDWNQFTIWNAGKQGRKFFNSLSEENKNKVRSFCDVDVKKIDKDYVPFDPATRKAGRAIKIQHYKEALPPFIICVKLDMTDGDFESNLYDLNLEENKDYILFS